MRKQIIALLVTLTGLLSACALGDVVNTTSLPPITLAPPPTLNLVGSCDDTKALETWLQVSSELRETFQTQMNAAAAKEKYEIYTDVMNLAALRDSGYSVATPDCAANAGMKLSDTMSQAVTAFQSYVNGDSSNLGNIVVDINNQLDNVQAAQIELIQRMEMQFQQQAQPPAATP